MQKHSEEINKHISKPIGDNTKVQEVVEERYPFVCQICGATWCQETSHNFMTPEVVIKDNKSDWAASDILSAKMGIMSKEYSLIKNLKEANITAIFNIQQEKERPYLKENRFMGILSSFNGESTKFNNCYDHFSKYKIQVFNLCLEGITTDMLLKTLKQMRRILEDGHKIALHSHLQNGAIRLLMAAWEIYYSDVPARQAIQKARKVSTLIDGKPGIRVDFFFAKWYQCRRKPKKFKYYVLAKEKEGALFGLEKELKEARITFQSSPWLKLEDYLLRQKKILPLVEGSDAVFIPNIVLSCLKRMEDMMASGKFTAHNIALAFTSPNGENTSIVLWDNSHEKSLESFKKQINTGKFTPYTVHEPRYLAQLILDFFDQLASPAIKTQVIFDDKVTLTTEKKDQFRSKMEKREMHLIEYFANFFSRLVEQDKTSVEVVKKAILRVCISLLLERKEKDKCFRGRSMIKEEYARDQSSQLCLFIQKWINLD